MTTPQIEIDPARCNRDGLCVTVCSSRVLQQIHPDTPPQAVRSDACIACGHCVAVCPRDAVRHSLLALESCPLVNEQPAVPPEVLLHTLRRRRSVRQFRQEPVPHALLEQLLDAGRFAPSASNAQVFRFIVVEDQEKIARLARLSLGPFRLVVRVLGHPVGRALARLFAGRSMAEEGIQSLEELRRMVDGPAKGEDWILFHAPALILIHAPKSAPFAETDCANAQHQIALLADALGLGTTTIGFFIISSRFSAALRKELALPAGHRLYGTLVLGWPRLRWRRLVERRAAQVEWR